MFGQFLVLCGVCDSSQGAALLGSYFAKGLWFVVLKALMKFELMWKTL
jgi:hypothetical protein